MFTVQTPQGTFKVVFQHERKSTKKHRQKTYCKLLIWDVSENKFKDLESGIAHCSRKDCYNKNTGRKNSLKDALSSFDREIRKLFWSKYFEVRNGKLT